MTGEGEAPGPHFELVRIRAEMGLTIQELAEMVELDPAELAEMEDGKRPVTHEFLTELMEELNAKGA